MELGQVLTLPKSHRRAFIGILVLLVVVLILFDPALWNEPKELFVDYGRKLAATLISALFMLWIVVSFLPSHEMTGAIEEVEPDDLPREFRQMLEAAAGWRYKGNFGRYFRNAVLPALSRRANVQVIACVLDPLDQELCEKHAAYRGSIRAVDAGRKYDADAVATQVLITVVKCAWYSVNRGMAIDLFVTRVFDPVRIDSNEKQMILTVEDRSKSALKITREHFTYEHFNLQLQTVRSQAKRMELGGMRRGVEIAALQEEDIANVLAGAGMRQLAERLGIGEILAACRNDTNPYA
jgi:hypothetical protein